MGCNGQGAGGGIFIENDGAEVSARGVESAGASGWSAPDDGYIDFDYFHVKLGGRRRRSSRMKDISISTVSANEIVTDAMIDVVATNRGILDSMIGSK